jgi:hypothetical protein
VRKWIIPVMAVIAVVLVLYGQGFFGVQHVSREEAISIIKDKYPDSEPEPVYEEDCGSGRSCWRTELTDGAGSSVTIEIDSSTGDSSEEFTQCTGWWCDAPECSYVSYEQGDGYTVTRYNTGCSSPTQSCNATHEACSVCQLKEDCIRKTITDYGNETVYLFEVVETPAYGTINTTGGECFIYDKNSDMIFWNMTSPSECEMIITYYTKCAYDICDFIPTYTLIPI